MDEQGGSQRVKQIKEHGGDIGRPAAPQAVCAAADDQGQRKNNRQPIEDSRLAVLSPKREGEKTDQIAQEPDEEIDGGEWNPAVKRNDLISSRFEERTFPNL